MLFWDPHGRFLLACIPNNQLFFGACSGSLWGYGDVPREPWGYGCWDEGTVWLLRLSIRRFVGMLRAQSGDSVRAIPLTVMWLSRQPQPAPFFPCHTSLSPLHFQPLLIQLLPDSERSLKTALVIIPKHILVIYAWLPDNLRQFIILFPIFLFYSVGVLLLWTLIYRAIKNACVIMALLRWQHDIGTVIVKQVWNPSWLQQWTMPDLACPAKKLHWWKTSIAVWQIERVL